MTRLSEFRGAMRKRTKIFDFDFDLICLFYGIPTLMVILCRKKGVGNSCQKIGNGLYDRMFSYNIKYGKVLSAHELIFF